MPIPLLDSNGVLPIGIHVATREELIRRFCVGQRQLRAHALVEFFDYVSDAGIFRAVYVDGSFTTKKAEPKDIDVALEVLERLTREELALHPTIQRLTQTAFTDGWGIHCEYAFHPLLQETGEWILGHFQDMKPETAQELGVPRGTRKGIVKVIL